MSKKEINRGVLGIFIRYLIILVLIALSYFQIIYGILLKATIYPSSFLLNFFYSSFVSGSFINVFVNDRVLTIEIIAACVAVSAYILLIILNLTTRMTLKQRMYSLIFSVLLLLVVNILRILVFSLLFVRNSAFFDVLHLITWYVLSIVMVICIWFLNVYFFKIKNIPVYSDFKYLYSLLNKRRKMK
jgi:exosortase/archaeosortase family protein